MFLVEAWIASAVVYACTTLGCLFFSLGYYSSAPEWLAPVLWPRTWLCELMWEQHSGTRPCDSPPTGQHFPFGFPFPVVYYLHIFSSCSRKTYHLLFVVVCWSHINSHNQVRGHNPGSSHSGAEEYPRENTHTTQGGTRIYHSWRNSCLHQGNHTHNPGSSHYGAEEYPRENTHTTQGGTRIYHSWRNSCLNQKHIRVKSGVSLRCARSMPVHTSHYSRLEKPTISIATQGRLPRIPRIYYT